MKLFNYLNKILNLMKMNIMPRSKIIMIIIKRKLIY